MDIRFVRYDRDLPNFCREKGKFLDPEVGGNNYFETLASTSIYQTTWHYIPEESSVFSTCYCRSVDLLWQLNSRMHKVIDYHVICPVTIQLYKNTCVVCGIIFYFSDLQANWT